MSLDDNFEHIFQNLSMEMFQECTRAIIFTQCLFLANFSIVTFEIVLSNISTALELQANPVCSFFFASQSQARILWQGKDDVLDGGRLFWKDRDLPPLLNITVTELRIFNSEAASSQQTTKGNPNQKTRQETWPSTSTPSLHSR